MGLTPQLGTGPPRRLLPVSGNATPAHHCHDISDRTRETIAPHLHGGPGEVGPPHWRTLARPAPDYGHWGCPLAQVSDDPDLEWLMIDASHVKVHQDGTGAVGGNQAVGRTKRDLNTRLHLVVAAHGMPVRMAVTAGTVADCTQAEALIEGIEAEYLLADLGYDTNRVLAGARAGGWRR